MQSRAWQLKASWRDTLLLLREFHIPLLLFFISITGAGILYYFIAAWAHEPVDGWMESIYLILTMTFLQSAGGFPHHPILQIFYFIMPLIGAGVLAQGLADFGILLFNRRARSKEWEMAVASTFSKHTILVGLGHLGYRVVCRLHAVGVPVVVIELNPAAHLASTVQKMRIPVIHDDASRLTTLEAAGVKKAHTIVLCTQNDALNLNVALQARTLNPSIQVVVRIFDEDFANSLQDQFGFIALSATAMAAPAFAAAASGVDITNPITVEGESLSIARLLVTPKSSLKRFLVGAFEQEYNVSIVLLKHDGRQEMHPPASQSIAAGDTLVVLGTPDRLNVLVHDN